MKSYWAFLCDSAVTSVITASYFVLFVFDIVDQPSLDFYVSAFSVIYFMLALIHQGVSYFKLPRHKVNFRPSDLLTQFTCFFIFVCYGLAPVLNLFDKQHEAFEGIGSLWLLFAAMCSLRISYDELQLKGQEQSLNEIEINNNDKLAA